VVALQHAAWRAVPGLRHGFLPGRVEPDRPVALPRQVHGTVVVTAGDVVDARPEADGIAVAAAGTLVGVVTADCAPILLLAPGHAVAAAVHAGWRGAAAGIVDAALAHLRREFGVEPAAVEAAVGPAIGACCYEVGPEVRAAFEARSAATTSQAWHRRDGRLRLDLRAAVGALLAAAGVRHVVTLGPCTRCSPAYASYRRDGSAAGRQVSFIGWA
jgi:YfiH family protein